MRIDLKQILQQLKYKSAGVNSASSEVIDLHSLVFLKHDVAKDKSKVRDLYIVMDFEDDSKISIQKVICNYLPVSSEQNKSEINNRSKKKSKLRKRIKIRRRINFYTPDLKSWSRMCPHLSFIFFISLDLMLSMV